MFVFVLLCFTLCLFQFCNHLEEEVKAGCLLLLGYRCIVTVNVLLLFCWFAECDCGIYHWIEN